MMTKVWPCCLSVVFLAACGGPGLRLTMLDASVQRPSNIAVYFTVDTEEGEPVPGLTAEQFRIYEDGQLVSVFESKQTILNPARTEVSEQVRQNLGEKWAAMRNRLIGEDCGSVENVRRIVKEAYKEGVLPADDEDGES